MTLAEMYRRAAGIILTRKEVIIYFLVGGITFLADYGTFFALFEYLHVSLFIANASGLLIGFLVSFMGNRLFVFQANKNNSHHSTAKQIGLYVVLLALNTLLSYGIIQVFRQIGLVPAMGKVGAIVVIALWNYVVYKKIIFKKLDVVIVE